MAIFKDKTVSQCGEMTLNAIITKKIKEIFDAKYSEYVHAR